MRLKNDNISCHVETRFDLEAWLNRVIVPALLREYVALKRVNKRGAFEQPKDELVYAPPDTKFGGPL